MHQLFQFFIYFNVSVSMLPKHFVSIISIIKRFAQVCSLSLQVRRLLLLLFGNFFTVAHLAIAKALIDST